RAQAPPVAPRTPARRTTTSRSRGRRPVPSDPATAARRPPGLPLSSRRPAARRSRARSRTSRANATWRAARRDRLASRRMTDPLYVLAFDHRHSLMTSFFGLEGAPTAEDVARAKLRTQIIWEGLLRPTAEGCP